MNLRAGPADELFHVRLEHDVEIIEVARAPAQPTRRIAHHLGGIGQLQQDRAGRFVDFGGGMGVAVRQVAEVRRVWSGLHRPACRRGQCKCGSQHQKLTMKARRTRSSHWFGDRPTA